MVKIGAERPAQRFSAHVRDRNKASAPIPTKTSKTPCLFVNQGGSEFRNQNSNRVFTILFAMPEDDNSKSETYRWRGKFVNEKQYKRMLQLSELGKRRKGCKKKPETDPAEIRCNVRGNRIVDLEYMSKNMNCTGCKARLDLRYIEQETIKGAASIFSIRCHECLLVNTVRTGNTYTNPLTGKNLFVINTKVALGSIQTGISEGDIAKFFNVLDLPKVDSQTFQKHKRIVEPIVEAEAEEKRKKCRMLK